MAVAHAQHPADVAQRGLGGHRAEGGDLAHRGAAVAVLDVVDDAVAVALAEVDVEVGHRDPLGIQEALEQQVVLQRIQVGDRQHIGHQRARARAPARAHRAAVGLGPADEVRHDQEVAGKAHLQDRRQLELQPLDIARALGVALRGIGEEQLQAIFQALEGELAEVVGHRHGRAVGQQRRGKVRQLRLAQHQRQAAAPGDLDGVVDRAGNVGEECGHLGLRLEVLVTAEAAHALGVAQRVAVGHADPRLVGLEVVGFEELDRVGGDDRQAQLRRQGHGRAHVRLVTGQLRALQLEVEAARKERRQPLRHIACARRVAHRQRLADCAHQAAGERDQPAAEFLQPRPLHPGLVAALHIADPRARQDLAQVQIALAVLHQQQQPGGGAGIAGGGRAVGLEPDVDADDRLHALLARGVVELDAAEQIGQIGDGHRGLAVLRGGIDRVVDPQRAVDHGKFGVGAQVDEVLRGSHRGIVGSGCCNSCQMS